MLMPDHRSAPRQQINLAALSEAEMMTFVTGLGWPRYRAHQILRWIHQGRLRDCRGMTNLSQDQRAILATRAYIGRSCNVRTLTAQDGTKKFLLTLEDGTSVETVLIPDDARLTLCLSTQIGCTLDCTFCLTGTMGLIRNLKAYEIVEQVLAIEETLVERQRITNLVFMGMGEPLANFEAVAEAVARLTNKHWGLGFSSRRITISTAGLTTRLKDVAGLGVNLAISLNAPTDDLRSRIMPTVNRIHPLRTLLAACRRYPLPPQRRLTFEYVLLAGVNDSLEDAHQVSRLLRGLRCKVNLIPFNEFPGSSYRRSSNAAIEAFQTVLRREGFDAFIRKSRGRDVLGACGQLGRTVAPAASVLLTPMEARC